MQKSSVAVLAGPEHPALQELHAYWLAKRGAALAPPRSAIDPAEIRHLLPRVGLADVVGTPPTMRYRLFGTGLVQGYGEDITGKHFEDIDFNGLAPDLRAILLGAVAACEARFLRVEFTKKSGRHVRYEQAFLPLSADGATANMVLTGFNVEAAYDERPLRK